MDDRDSSPLPDDSDAPIMGRIVETSPMPLSPAPLSPALKSANPKVAAQGIHAPTSQVIGEHRGRDSNPYSPNHGDEHAPYEPLGSFGRHQLPILITIFLAAGILGLPLIFLSPAFSRTEKVFWTIMVLIYTAAVFGLLGLMIMVLVNAGAF